MCMLTVPRFESKVTDNKRDISVRIKKTDVYVKDHKTDEVVALISLFDEQKKNKELTEVIIQTIEEFLDQE